MPAPSSRLMSEAEVVQQPCQVFVALAEEGWTRSPATLAAAGIISRPCSRAPAAPDTLVLGCTHFPVLAEAIRETIGEAVALVDSAETTAQAVAEALVAAGLGSTDGAQRRGAVFRHRFAGALRPRRRDLSRAGDRAGRGRAGRSPRALVRLSAAARCRAAPRNRRSGRPVRGRAAPWCRRRRSPRATGSSATAALAAVNTARP